MDRCVDASQWIIKHYARLSPETDTRILKYTESDGVGWRFRPAYLRREAYRLASNDIILNTSADLRLDPSIATHLHRVNGSVGLVNFGYYDYPYNPQGFIKKIISSITGIHGYAGLIAFSRKAWMDTENLEDLKSCPRAEDTHLQLAMKGRYRIEYIGTRSLHLRPSENFLDHYNRGVAQWQMIHSPWPASLLHSVVMLRPACFVGYMHTRMGVGFNSSFSESLLLSNLLGFNIWDWAAVTFSSGVFIVSSILAIWGVISG